LSSKAFAHCHEGRDGLGRRLSAQILQAADEGRAAPIDGVIGDFRCDDLAPQPMPRMFAVPLDHSIGEIADQIRLETGIVRQVGSDQIVKQHDLGIGEQHADFGTRQALAFLLSFGHLLRRRQLLDLAIEQAAQFEASMKRSW
jgi:hypothetical protein